MSNPETSANQTPPGSGAVTAVAEPVNNTPAIFCSDLGAHFRHQGY